jgi:Putative peptidoglycan binding domain
MAGRKFARSWALVPVAAGALLAGCAQTPMGPTVAVMPGPGKPFDAFQADQATCKSFAAGQVQGQAQAANQQAVGAAVLTTALGAGLGAAGGALGGNAGAGAAVGAAVGAGAGTAIGANGSSNAQMGIQAQYDNAFAQCMYSRGDQVPGYAAPVAMAPPPSYSGGPDPALVRSVQTELIRLRYLGDVADGTAGPKTVAAIRSYERATGLPVDGAVSPGLLAKLQATPSSQAAGWVAPAQPGAPMPASAGVTATAPAQGSWVAPAPSGGAVTPAAATSPVAPTPSGWVAPAAPP